jgi:hypothetical protein
VEEDLPDGGPGMPPNEAAGQADFPFIPSPGPPAVLRVGKGKERKAHLPAFVGMEHPKRPVPLAGEAVENAVLQVFLIPDLFLFLMVHERQSPAEILFLTFIP